MFYNDGLLNLGILSVVTVHVFMCQKDTDDRLPLFGLMRSGAGRCFIVFTGFIWCCNVTNSVVHFSPFLRVLLQVLQAWCYNRHFLHFLQCVTYAA